MILLCILGLYFLFWMEDTYTYKPLPKSLWDMDLNRTGKEPDLDLACCDVLDFDEAFK